MNALLDPHRMDDVEASIFDADGDLLSKNRGTPGNMIHWLVTEFGVKEVDVYVNGFQRVFVQDQRFLDICAYYDLTVNPVIEVRGDR